MFHQQILLDGGRGNLDVERLVLDEDIARIALNGSSHHNGPCLNEPPLVVGSLYAVDAHELLDDGIYTFCVGSSHENVRFDCLM